MVKLTPEQICDSKEKHSLISVQYIISVTNGDAAQSYYWCELCNHYHIYTIQKKVVNNRKSTLFYKDKKDVHLAKKNKKLRPGFKKRR